jgi:hypothetical protein
MYGSSKEKCKKWLLREHPNIFPIHYPGEASAEVPIVDSKSAEAGGEVPTEAMENLAVNDGENEDKKHQSRGNPIFHKGAL